MPGILDSLRSVGGRGGRKMRQEEMQEQLRQYQERERQLLRETEEQQRSIRQMEEQLKHYRQLEQAWNANIPVLRKSVEWDIACNTCGTSMSKNKQQQLILWHGTGEAIYYRKHDEETMSDAQTGAGPASSLPIDIAVQHSGHHLEFHWREVGDWERRETTTPTATIASKDSSIEETKSPRREPEDTTTTTTTVA